MGKYQYFVDMRGNHAHVVRGGNGEGFRGYNPRLPGKWYESVFLDAMAWGQGSFMDYDDCSEEEALEYMKIADEECAKWQKETIEEEKKEYYDDVRRRVEEGIWRIPKTESNPMDSVMPCTDNNAGGTVSCRQPGSEKE